MSTSTSYRPRSDSRRIAFQLLFSSEINELSVETILDDGSFYTEVGLPCEFSRRLLLGVRTHQDQIDALISETSIDWQLSRLPLADKNILRLAIYEMLYEDDIPIKVSIDEAVELAKGFGGADKSPIFVNGVLGRIADRLETGLSMPGDDASAETGPAAAGLAAADNGLDDTQPKAAQLAALQSGTACAGTADNREAKRV